MDGEVKAVQLGGPSGIFIDGRDLDIPVDYESIAAAGGFLGSGTVAVVEKDVCMVEKSRDIAAYLHEQSCGQCVFCREGTLHIANIMAGIAENNGHAGDLDLIREIGGQMKNGCIGGLGRTAANPILTSMTLFAEEFDAHIKEKICPTK